MSERERFEAGSGPMLSDEWIEEHWRQAYSQKAFPALTHYTAAVERAVVDQLWSGQAASGSSQGARSDVQNGVGVGQPEAPTAAPPTDELPAVAAWRAARKASIEAVEAYNAALVKARERDEIDGFGYTCVNREYQAMNDASNVAHRLIKPMLDALYAHPPARSGADPTGRTPTDYALEFAEYMAKGAEGLLEAINAEDNARLSVEEAWSTEIPSGDELEKLAQASESRGHFMRGLRGKIYEFRKRRDRAIARSGAGSEEGRG